MSGFSNISINKKIKIKWLQSLSSSGQHKEKGHVKVIASLVEPCNCQLSVLSETIVQL